MVDATPETLQKAQGLFKFVQEILRLYDSAYGAGHHYTAQLHDQYLSGNVNALQGLDDLVQLVRSLDMERQVFLERPIELHLDAELDDEFIAAVERARTGKSPLGFLPFGKGQVRAKIQAVTISSLRPRDETDWSHVHAYLVFRRRARATLAR